MWHTIKIKTATPFLLRPFAWIMMLFLYIPTVLKNFGKTFYDEIYESDTKFPQLFIYSTGDEIIDYKGLLPTVWISKPVRLVPLVKHRTALPSPKFEFRCWRYGRAEKKNKWSLCSKIRFEFTTCCPSQTQPRKIYRSSEMLFVQSHGGKVTISQSASIN